MCGIAGIVRRDGAPVSEREIRSMCAAMVHRGPDEEGVYVGDGVALGMRRLSIIDLGSGQQPIANEDRTVWIVFNGEIYNYRELRRELQQRGHVFRTASDTETIVHLYEDLGPRCVERLRGMFGFAIWDTRTRSLLLARDRLGIKPLYYAERDGELVFASELKPILQLPHIDRALSWEGTSHLFTFLATPSSQSIVEGIRKLEPARVAVSAPQRDLRISRYWSVDFTADEAATEDDLVERLRELLVESVALHQISDVPIGAFLSGGIDSSAVVATMAGMVPEPIKTFSIGFAEAGYDELRYAREVAAAFGTDHYDVVLRPDVVKIVEDLTWYLDEPFGDTSAIPTYMVSKLASEHVKVVLSGDGGDELFAGYDKYVVEGRERRLDAVPVPLRRAAGAIGNRMPEGMRGRRFLRHLALDGPRRYLDASTLFRADELRKLFADEAFEQVARHDPAAASLGCFDRPDGDWLAAVQHRDLESYLPLDILTKVDRMTMAHSIEARPPLVDHKLVEFAATVPARIRLKGGTTKYLFKRAMRGILPDTIIDRPKHGFAVPIAHWFRGELAGFARDLLLSDRCRQRGFFRPQYVERLLQLNQQGRDLDLQLWTMLSFELWCQRFLDAAPEKVRLKADTTGANVRGVRLQPDDIGSSVGLQPDDIGSSVRLQPDAIGSSVGLQPDDIGSSVRLQPDRGERVA
jgi:asparagine synthase (glutamine-hydrolysing)